jgi:DNA-binding CsgD family transcriptional regulator
MQLASEILMIVLDGTHLSNGKIKQHMNITKKTVEVYMLKAYKHFRSLYGKIYGV